MYLIFSFCIAMLSCFLTISWLRRSNLAKAVIDLPNHRSLHTRPTPKVGGVGIAAGVIFSITVSSIFSAFDSHILVSTLIAFAALVGISILDDATQLTVKVRLSLHLLIVLIWIIWCFSVAQLSTSRQLAPLSIAAITLLVTLGIVWATNLFNFMDGSDGLAGCMALLGFTAYGIAASMVGDFTLFAICICACGAILSFLYFNWPAAKVFMGDSGSIPLGFLAAAIGTIGVFRGYWPADFPLMLFAMFWVDATFTLVVRYAKGRKLGEPHRDHWYQKAIQSGNTHQKVLLIHVICNIVVCGLALFSLKHAVTEVLALRTFIIGLVLSIALGFGVWAEGQYKSFRSIQIK
jgi:UDP-GlcNAc:undecaprenyl-phosphate/decaprenyl-phosphate GlcNAc-1-phosphate transferase